MTTSKEKFFSKTNFTAGAQCPKILWLDENKPEVAIEEDNSAKMKTGIEIGNLAKKYYGENYVSVPYDTDYKKMAEETARLIEAKTPIICEATFIYNDCLCMVDILRVKDDGTLSITEVKSSTSTKPINIQDVGFQLYVVKNCGYNVSSVMLMHLDNSYIRQGELDIKGLFEVENVTKEASDVVEDIEERLTSMENKRDSGEEPEVVLSSHCNNPYPCKYKEYCWSVYPSPNVFDLSYGARKAPKLRDKGIISFEDLYESDDFSDLTEKQQIQVAVYVENKPPQINKEAVGSFLNELWYPLHFLDFESFQLACPIYDGTWPYQQIVSQYSLHYLDKQDGKLQHAEFLAKEGESPCRAVAEALIRDIPREACIIVWNKSFEMTRIKEMAQMFPDLADELLARNENVVDLMVPFKQFDWYQKEFGKSSSIKVVLPALFPDDPRLDYHSLEGVHNGVQAANAYVTLSQNTPSEIEIIRNQLLRYCELDTYAMVVIWAKMVEEVFGRKVNV